MRRPYDGPPAGWLQIGWKKLAVAIAMLPVATLFFAMGEAYDGWTKVAIAVTILQWIMLAEAVGHRPRSVPSRIGLTDALRSRPLPRASSDTDVADG